MTTIREPVSSGGVETLLIYIYDVLQPCQDIIGIHRSFKSTQTKQKGIIKKKNLIIKNSYLK